MTGRIRLAGVVASNVPDAATIARMRAALRRLSPLQRHIFLEIRFEDVSFDELAKRIGQMADAVEREFVQGLYLFDRYLRQPPRLWWRIR